MIDGRALSNTVGHRARPDLRLAPPRAHRARRDRAHRLLDDGGLDARRSCSTSSTSIATPRPIERASTLAWTQAQVQLHHLGITAGEASLFQRLASHVLYANPTLRPPSDTIIRGAGAQSGLWTLGISGDLPIVLLRIADSDDLDVARELLQAHEYWRMKQLAVDLVILNERRSSYVQDLQIALETLLRTSQIAAAGFAARNRRAACSCCAAISFPPRRRLCWLPSPAS